MIAGYIEIAVALIAIGVVIFVLHPYVPSWAVFASAVVGAFLCLIDILEDGPEKQNVGLLAVASLAALGIWWRELRGTRDRRQQGP